LVFLGLVGPGIESESIRVFPAGAKESDSLFVDFSRIVPTLATIFWCYSQARTYRERGDGPVELCSVLPFALMEEGGSDGFLKE
jgi:hypothetical protein